MVSAEICRHDAVAARLADELLTEYPSSAEAHGVKAQLATRAGRQADAEAELEEALRLVQSGAYALFVANAAPGVVLAAAKGLEDELTVARARRRP